MAPGGPPTVRVRAADPAPIEVRSTRTGLTWSWSVANAGSRPATVDAVSLAWDLDVDPMARVEIDVNGYQSWSASERVVLGDHVDPSTAKHSLELYRAWYMADPEVAASHEVRSDQVVTVETGDRLLHAAFMGGADHAGTFRIRRDDDRVTFAAEAYLGGATLAPGEERALHPVRFDEADDGAAGLLDAAGAAADARAGSPFVAGWCSWYHYFTRVTEDDVRQNLRRAADLPLDVFQIDDGYQPFIGDWLVTNEKFPSSHRDLAASIDATGMTPGIWLAPFLVDPRSDTFARHPDWVARWRDGSPLIAHLADDWGGEVYALDTTRPEVISHLETVARSLVEAGYRYLKLDFTYAPALPGIWHDAGQTPAQRVRLGYDAIRRAVGDEVVLLGCGAPLGPCIGVVDAMRIGPDVAPWFHRKPDQAAAPGFEDTVPALAHAERNTLARQGMHRRWWVNDPDCLMIRPTDTELTEAERVGWCETVATLGQMPVISDDLSLYRPSEVRLVEETVEAARANDRSP